MKFVQFIATDGYNTHEWTSTNVGTYVEDFAKFWPTDEALSFAERLRRGEIVVFPGFWTIDEIKHKFGGTGDE